MNLRLIVVSCVAGLAGIGAALAVSACQSSQAKNDALAKKGATILKEEKGLKITETSSVVKVVDTAVLSDANGAAVAVTLHNDSQQGLAHIPIAINVKDAKGKSVFKNDDPGLEPSLVEVPEMKPGETVTWVDDQILATGTPKSVDVRVGVTQDSLPPNAPEITASTPKLKNDPYSGLQVEGNITNQSDVTQNNLRMFAVARQGGKIVAAGRGGIKLLKGGGDRAYHIYFIGNPTGADVSVWAPPSTFD